MARRLRRSISRGPKNNVWSVVLLEQALVDDTPTVEAVIVAAGEWQPASSGFEHATLLRIRGWLTASASFVASDSQVLFAMIYVVDKDAASANPLNATSYAEEDVLWTGGWAWPQRGTGAVERDVSQQMLIDVKSMRKIDSGRDVRLALRASSTTVLEVSGIVRALIRKS